MTKYSNHCHVWRKGMWNQAKERLTEQVRPLVFHTYYFTFVCQWSRRLRLIGFNHTYLCSISVHLQTISLFKSETYLKDLIIIDHGNWKHLVGACWCSYIFHTFSLWFYNAVWHLFRVHEGVIWQHSSHCLVLKAIIRLLPNYPV